MVLKEPAYTPPIGHRIARKRIERGGCREKINARATAEGLALTQPFGPVEEARRARLRRVAASAAMLLRPILFHQPVV